VGTAERRERDRLEMREAILAAAMKLFAEESFEKTTMRRIAEAIEYTPGAIYSYFKDKDEILYALHQRGFDTLYAMQQPALAIADPVKRLRRLAEIYLEFAFANPQAYDLMFIASGTGRSIEEADDWHCGERAYDVLRRTIAEIIDADRMRGTRDVEVATFAAWAAVHGIASLVIRNRARILPEEHRDRIVSGAAELLLQLTRPPPGKNENDR
jgi:AcrR family transcriptional regulator